MLPQVHPAHGPAHLFVHIAVIEGIEDHLVWTVHSGAVLLLDRQPLQVAPPGRCMGSAPPLVFVQNSFICSLRRMRLSKGIKRVMRKACKGIS